jgi:translocator protein
MLLRFIVFLLFNFGALALGGLFTKDGVTSEWYQNLAKAPWTPPGWVFGAAWTTIMICFSIYMTILWDKTPNKKQLALVFGVQWVLNVVWNPLFFNLHQLEVALVVIVMLTLVVGYFLFGKRSMMGWASLLVAPYFLWLLIATSLNAYPLFA